MAQKRYINYEQPLTSLEENLRLQGLGTPGILCGWDAFTYSGTTVSWNHLVTGMLKTDLVPTTQSGPYGIVMSNQGTFILEDATVDITVPLPGTLPRIDVVYMDHQHVQATGGQAATYSINQGAEAANPTPPSPEVPNDKIQVVIGYLYVPGGNPGTHATTKWVRKAPGIANLLPITKNLNGTTHNVDDRGADDFNLNTTVGMFVINSINNRPHSSGGSIWALLVQSDGTNISQMATSLTNGKTWVRASIDAGLTWGSWRDLNNESISDFSPTYLELMIGSDLLANLNYSTNNYVVDGTSLEAAVGVLDAAVYANALAISNNDADISSLQVDVGDLTYVNEYVVTDGDPLTTSIDDLDSAIGNRLYSANNYITDSEALTLSLNDLDVALKTVSDYIGLKSKVIDIGDWDMDTTSSVNVTHGLTASDIRMVKCSIRQDSGTTVQMFSLEGTWEVGNAGSGTISWAQSGAPSTYITLSRTLNGFFDNTSYNATAYNRGYVTIWYV